MDYAVRVIAFEDLTLRELYDILKLRNEVFIVEQNCPYNDLDDKDLQAHHVLLVVGGKLAAYCRLLPEGVSYAEMSIGRVLTAPAFRSQNWGRMLMEKAIEACYITYKKGPIRIGAQYYLKAFYESFGFVTVSEIYDEDGIDHILMLLP
jgi:ElaA protein